MDNPIPIGGEYSENIYRCNRKRFWYKALRWLYSWLSWSAFPGRNLGWVAGESAWSNWDASRRWGYRVRDRVYRRATDCAPINISNIPVLKPQQVVRILENLEFVEVRQKGSHKQFRHQDGRWTTVPFHKGRDISPRLLRQIAIDIGLTVEELLESLWVRCSGILPIEAERIRQPLKISWPKQKAPLF